MCFLNAANRVDFSRVYLLSPTPTTTHAIVFGLTTSTNFPLPAEATGVDFVCFVVINLSVLSANRVDFGLFCIHFPILAGLGLFLFLSSGFCLVLAFVAHFYYCLFFLFFFVCFRLFGS